MSDTRIEKYTDTANVVSGKILVGKTTRTLYRVVEDGQVIADGIATKREAEDIAWG